VHRAEANLRSTFDEVAALYDSARPTYPGQVFDDLLAPQRSRRLRASLRSDAVPGRQPFRSHGAD
jgi:hypothetical protein